MVYAYNLSRQLYKILWLENTIIFVRMYIDGKKNIIFLVFFNIFLFFLLFGDIKGFKVRIEHNNCEQQCEYVTPS